MKRPLLARCYADDGKPFIFTKSAPRVRAGRIRERAANKRASRPTSVTGAGRGDVKARSTATATFDGEIPLLLTSVVALRIAFENSPVF
jgi:hypothetical protein